MVTGNRFKLFLAAAGVAVAAGVAAVLVFALPPAPRPEANLTIKVASTLTPEQARQVEQDIAELKAGIARGEKGSEPDFMRAYLAVGQKYELLGELGQARAAYQAAARESPKAALPQVALGVLYQRMGSTTLARQALRQAITNEPAVVHSWEQLIDLERNVLGQGDGELRGLFSQALAATSNDARLAQKYAEYLVDTGARLDAIALYEALVKAYPGSASLRARLEELKSGAPVR